MNITWALLYNGWSLKVKLTVPLRFEFYLFHPPVVYLFSPPPWDVYKALLFINPTPVVNLFPFVHSPPSYVHISSICSFVPHMFIYLTLSTPVVHKSPPPAVYIEYEDFVTSINPLTFDILLVYLCTSYHSFHFKLYIYIWDLRISLGRYVIRNFLKISVLQLLGGM